MIPFHNEVILLLLRYSIQTLKLKIKYTLQVFLQTYNFIVI